MASVNMKRAVITLLQGTKVSTGYYGLQDVYDNTDSLADDILWQFSAAERATTFTRWAANPIKVTGEYARSNYQAPKIMVLRSSDSERLDFAGDYIGVNETLSENDSFHEWHEWGSDLDESVQLIIQAPGHGPGNRDDIYMVLRELIIRARKYFEALGLSNLLWQQGSDGDGFQPDKSPHIVHEARATLRYINPLRWSEKSTRITEFNSNLTGYNQGQVTVDPYSEET